jgi:methionyl-tRNA synthetase
VPGDPAQVIYIWFDALVNYVSALGLGGDEALLDRYWRAGERTHVIGKGIARFHAVYWVAFLLSADLPLPDRILVHGYLTVDGEKIRKSGRGFEVGPVVDRFGVDALRWYFVRRCRTRVDSDVVTEEIGGAYDGDLADRLGNLVQRTTALVAKRGGRVPDRNDTPHAAELRAITEALPARVDAALDAFLPDDAAAAIVAVLDAANRYLEITAPWRDPDASALHAPLDAARIVAGELAPFVPGVSATILARLGTLAPGAPLPHGPPPLPRLTKRA